MRIFTTLLLFTLGIIFVASIIPLIQYFYEKYINKETYSLRYYFSSELFECHLLEKTFLHPSLMCRVLTREKLNEMWNCEMKKTLP